MQISDLASLMSKQRDQLMGQTFLNEFTLYGLLITLKELLLEHFKSRLSK